MSKKSAELRAFLIFNVLLCFAFFICEILFLFQRFGLRLAPTPDALCHLGFIALLARVEKLGADHAVR